MYLYKIWRFISVLRTHTMGMHKNNQKHQAKGLAQKEDKAKGKGFCICLKSICIITSICYNPFAWK